MRPKFVEDNRGVLRSVDDIRSITPRYDRSKGEKYPAPMSYQCSTEDDEFDITVFDYESLKRADEILAVVKADPGWSLYYYDADQLIEGSEIVAWIIDRFGFVEPTTAWGSWPEQADICWASPMGKFYFPDDTVCDSKAEAAQHMAARKAKRTPTADTPPASGHADSGSPRSNAKPSEV
jgi:hypothetical protein